QPDQQPPGGQERDQQRERGPGHRVEPEHHDPAYHSQRRQHPEHYSCHGVPPVVSTTSATARAWAMASGISTTQASSAYRSARITGSRRRPHTSRSRTVTVLTADHAQAGSSGPAPPPRNSGTAIAAPAVSSSHRPACSTSRSGPDSSASTPPARSRPAG